MKKIKILYTGMHPEILETVVRLINNNEKWAGYGAGNSELAIKLFKENEFDLVLLGSGISQECEDTLRKAFAEHNPGCKIVQHYGGGSGLLSNEILSALGHAHT